jgi:uncharacterized protein (TIGR00299 family) protein
VRHLWIDAGAGIAGDMLLGALVDAGAPIADMQRAVDTVIPETVRLATDDVRRAGLHATKVHVQLVADDLPQRSWADIRRLLESAGLDPVTRRRALATFQHLARAEAAVHGIETDAVHFHEVGSWDSIADIVGACAALSLLGVATVSGSPAAVGSGSVSTAHGELPLPGPAVLALAAGWDVFAGGAGELATPTGMALLTALSQRCQDLPRLRVQAVGTGAGSRDPGGRANVVRVVLGEVVLGEEVERGALGAASRALVIETNVDDLDPRVWPGVLEALLQGGASDAWLTPILMKKGRPAHTLSVLAPADRAPALRELVPTLVPTLGWRESRVVKTALDRTWREVECCGAGVRIKLGVREGRIVTATPEFDDVARLAAELGSPVRSVLDAAVAAAHAAGLRPGGYL